MYFPSLRKIWMGITFSHWYTVSALLSIYNQQFCQVNSQQSGRFPSQLLNIDSSCIHKSTSRVFLSLQKTLWVCASGNSAIKISFQVVGNEKWTLAWASIENILFWVHGWMLTFPNPSLVLGVFCPSICQNIWAETIWVGREAIEIIFDLGLVPFRVLRRRY